MVKNELYRYYIKVFDTSGDPKTDLVNGDFVKTVIINGVVNGITVTVTHVSVGNYGIEITPVTEGDYLIDVAGPAAAVPRYHTREEYCYPVGLEDLATEANVDAVETAILAVLNDGTYGLSALQVLLAAIDTSTELAARFTEIKGSGWTIETLKAIYDAVVGPQRPFVSFRG